MVEVRGGAGAVGEDTSAKGEGVFLRGPWRYFALLVRAERGRFCCAFAVGTRGLPRLRSGGLGVGLGCGLGVLREAALVLGEVAVSDLEGVEEEAGAARVDVVGGETLHDGAEGLLNLGPGVGHGDREGGLAGAALAGVGDGAAGFVVVVAETLSAHGRAAAAVAFGIGVAAAERAWDWLLRDVDGRFGHGYPPPGIDMVQNLQNKRPESGSTVLRS